MTAAADKWKIITAHGDYRLISPDCGLEELAWWPGQIINRLIHHEAPCRAQAVTPCGNQYPSLRAALAALQQAQQAQPEPCTCETQWEERGPGYSEPIIAEPDFYCAAHFPAAHRERETKAADGYAQASRNIRESWPAAEPSTWAGLPEAGRQLWRAWAECEMWDRDLAQDFAAGSSLTPPPAPGTGW